MDNKQQLLQQLFDKLKNSDYLKLQYIPTRKSFFGIFKEGENILNLFTKKKHLMFYYSFAPSLYLKAIISGNKHLSFFYRFCFLNEEFTIEVIKQYLGKDWFSSSVEAGLLVSKNNLYRLIYSVLPINKYLILRDSHYSYKYYEDDGGKPENRVYVGADSVKFVQYNQKFLKGKKFKSTLELGCGTGVQLICVENLSEKLAGIDINPRAVEFTGISAKLNGLEDRFTVLESDLFENLDSKFDLILANPWFIDLEKGGLEEIPFIIEKLDNYLVPNGMFAIYFGSFIKDGIDQGLTVLSKFATENGYDAIFQQLGRSVDPLLLDKFKELNISHIQSYYAVLTKGGKGSIKVLPPNIARRFRDSIYLPLQRVLGKKSNKDLV